MLGFEAVLVDRMLTDVVASIFNLWLENTSIKSRIGSERCNTQNIPEIWQNGVVFQKVKQNVSPKNSTLPFN